MPRVQVYHRHLEVFDPREQILDGRRMPMFHPLGSSDQIHQFAFRVAGGLEVALRRAERRVTQEVLHVPQRAAGRHRLAGGLGAKVAAAGMRAVALPSSRDSRGPAGRR
jgi:hypothetical protein